MANRYLIYSTGTTYSGTILRESAVNNPSVGEASLYSGFIIPAIQPLYLWQVSGGNVIPNTDTKINNYETATAPPPQPNDNITYGETTGITNTKINKFVGVTANIPLISASGQALSDSGYNIADIITAGSGVTNATFSYYTGTTAPNTYQTIANVNHFTGSTLPANYYNKTQINAYSASTLTQINSKVATTTFATYTGTTVPANYYNKTQINAYSGQTATLIGTKISKVTGATSNDIATFSLGGSVQDSGKQFTIIVNPVSTATNALIPTELAVRNAINQAVNAAIILQGDWNAATNTPNLQVTGITTGFAWRVSASGTTNLGGITLWAIGDLAIKSATGWIRMVSEDIAAIWGNISGTLSNQTDLQNALNLKLNSSTFATYTGTTVPNTYYNKTQINAYSASTLTQINSKVATTTFSTYTGTTVPNTYYNKTQINAYTAQTQTQINSKLNTSVFTGYTASTKNVDKKIQVISTLTLNANVVTPLEVTWSSVPVSADTYLWSGGTAVWIKSAGEYEVNYHIVLTNDAANQTHSIGSNLLLNGSTNPLTAGATNVVGSNSSAEISLNSAVLTLANNDRLDLAVFRIGNSGNANLVSGSTYLVLNKLS